LQDCRTAGLRVRTESQPPLQSCNSAILPSCYCTVKVTDASVVSHIIAMVPPDPGVFLAIEKVSCSMGASSVRLRISTRPRSADGR
jgi:hypothetical protein